MVERLHQEHLLAVPMAESDTTASDVISPGITVSTQAFREVPDTAERWLDRYEDFTGSLTRHAVVAADGDTNKDETRINAVIENEAETIAKALRARAEVLASTERARYETVTSEKGVGTWTVIPEIITPARLISKQVQERNLSQIAKIKSQLHQVSAAPSAPAELNNYRRTKLGSRAQAS